MRVGRERNRLHRNDGETDDRKDAEHLKVGWMIQKHTKDLCPQCVLPPDSRLKPVCVTHCNGITGIMSGISDV